MSEKKVYKITTSMFELKVNWNSKLVSLQTFLLIGCLAIKLFADKDVVNRLCTVILITDLLSMLASLFMGASIETVNEESTSETKDEVKESLDITVDSEKPVKKETAREKTKKSRKTSNEIRNKVPVPNPTPRPRDTASEEPSAVMNDVAKVIEETAPPERKVKPVNEMTAEDWEELFKMD